MYTYSCLTIAKARGSLRDMNTSNQIYRRGGWHSITCMAHQEPFNLIVAAMECHHSARIRNNSSMTSVLVKVFNWYVDSSPISVPKTWYLRASRANSLNSEHICNLGAMTRNVAAMRPWLLRPDAPRWSGWQHSPTIKLHSRSKSLSMNWNVRAET